jgi:hypothetical protein
MIDETMFAQEIELLCERFNRVPSQPVIVRYYEFLEARMTTTQFQEAAIAIFNQDQFWPSPQRFIDCVFGNLDDQASLEWSKLLAAHQSATRADVSTIARKVWSEIFAAGQLQGDNADQRASFVRRDFIQTYRAIQTIGDRPPGLMPAVTKLELETGAQMVREIQTAATKRKAEATT